MLALKKNKDEAAAFKRLYYLNYSSHPIMVNNINWPGYGECDIVACSKAGYTTEYEVKASRADFLAEMRNKAEKHMRLSAGLGPNRFYFITYPDMIKPAELLPKMGLIVIKGNRLDTVVKASRQHPEKADAEFFSMIANRLTRKAYGTFMPPHLS